MRITLIALTNIQPAGEAAQGLTELAPVIISEARLFVTLYNSETETAHLRRLKGNERASYRQFHLTTFSKCAA
jgi:hypothetical protein